MWGYTCEDDMDIWYDSIVKDKGERVNTNGNSDKKKEQRIQKRSVKQVRERIEKHEEPDEKYKWKPEWFIDALRSAYDDSRSVNFMTNDSIKLCAVNLKKDEMKELLPLISQALYRTIKDTDGMLSQTLRNIWKQFTDQSDLKRDKDTFENAEEEVNSLLIKLLTEQTPTLPRLTKGEKTVLKIRDQVYHHMDGKINIDSLVKQHKISKKTLYNSFKSLFGFTPDYFLRQLKLNLVHNDLKKGKPRP